MVSALGDCTKGTAVATILTSINCEGYAKSDSECLGSIEIVRHLFAHFKLGAIEKG